MVKRIDKPEGYFTKLPDHYMWYELTYKNETYCYVGIEIISIWASFHTHVLKWSHNIAKELHYDWKELKFISRSFGATQAIASNDDLDDARWPKFIKMFGFPEPQKIYLSKQEL